MEMHYLEWAETLASSLFKPTYYLLFIYLFTMSMFLPVFMRTCVLVPGDGRRGYQLPIAGVLVGF